MGFRPCCCPSPFPFAFPYVDVFPFTLLHLPLDFIRVSSLRKLRLMYLHPPVDPSLTHFVGEFPGLGLALVPDVVVPEAEQGCTRCRHVKFLPCSGFEPRTLQSDGRER